MKSQLNSREYFAQAYLLIVGIIQATVFTHLAKDTFDHVQLTHGGVSQFVEKVISKIGVLAGDPVIYMSCATFLLIVIVTYEYIIGLANLHRAFRPMDVIPTFFLGFAQTWMASSIGSSADWWAATLIFSVAGTLVYANTLTYNLKEIYANDRGTIRIVRRFFFGRVLFTVIFGFFVLGMWRFGVFAGLSELRSAVVALVYVGIFGIVYLGTGARFSRRMATYDRYNQADT